MRIGRKRNEVRDGAQEQESSAVMHPGPYDVSEIDVEDGSHVDLGSLLIPPVEGAELRMQVDEATGAILSVLLVGDQAALEARAFAAPKASGLWEDTRRQISAEVARQGGTCDEREGPFGPELFVQQPITMDDGQKGVQPSRVIGHEGPRWFLRATLLGQPAMEPENAGLWEDAIRGIAVRRGNEAMPPGEYLPLTLPENAQRVD